MTADLKERVARAMSEREGWRLEDIGYDGKEQFLMYADAAIAIVLEQAARAVERVRDDGLDKFAKDEYSRNYGRAMANDCAAAIRAMAKAP